MHPSPLLERADAVAGAPQDVDATVPAHYGSPLPEQAALVAGLALSALARDVVAVTGPDRRSWLTTLSSQVLTHLAPGDGGVETLLMDAQGHITHALAALDDGQVLWLVTEAGAGPALADFLDSMRFMLRVEATDRPDVQVLGAMGQGLEALLDADEHACCLEGLGEPLHVLGVGLVGLVYTQGAADQGGRGGGAVGGGGPLGAGTELHALDQVETAAHKGAEGDGQPLLAAGQDEAPGGGELDRPPALGEDGADEGTGLVHGRSDNKGLLSHGAHPTRLPVRGWAHLPPVPGGWVSPRAPTVHMPTRRWRRAGWLRAW